MKIKLVRYFLLFSLLYSNNVQNLKFLQLFYGFRLSFFKMDFRSWLVLRIIAMVYRQESLRIVHVRVLGYVSRTQYNVITKHQTQTHIDTPTQTLTHSHTNTHTHTDTHSYRHTLTHSHTPTHTQNHSHIHTLTYSHTLTH